jgi:NAD dependent epimerase/dehydratase family enzyme
VWTPGFALQLLMGGGSVVVIEGQRVLPRRALEWGYSFRFPALEAALADILK